MTVKYVRLKNARPQGATVLGYQVEFTRRRYANRHTYTWAYLILEDGKREVSLGDPYPGVHWKRSVLETAVRNTLNRLGKEAA